MAEEKVTPEEKLLRLIETKGKNTPSKPPLKKRHFDTSLLKKVMQGIGHLTLKKLFFAFNLKLVNRGLVILSLVMTLYLVFDFIKQRPDLSPTNYLKGTFNTQERIGKTSKLMSVNISEYLTEVNKRDIFHFLPVKSQVEVIKKDTLITLAANLKLVGIIWSKKPQAIVEDKIDNKTLLLNQGDEVRKIKIKQILKDKVILSFENEEAELM